MCLRLPSTQKRSFLTMLFRIKAFKNETISDLRMQLKRRLPKTRKVRRIPRWPLLSFLVTYQRFWALYTPTTLMLFFLKYRFSGQPEGSTITHTSLFVLYSPVHTIGFLFENAYFPVRFHAKTPETLIMWKQRVEMSDLIQSAHSRLSVFQASVLLLIMSFVISSSKWLRIQCNNTFFQ